MKQVTMESVKQRIAHIEDLNARGVGTKVQQQQFELSCLRELVAVTEHSERVSKSLETALGVQADQAKRTNQLLGEIKKAEAVIGSLGWMGLDTAISLELTKLNKQISDLQGQVSLLTEQRDALVVENVALNEKMDKLATWPGIEFYSSAWEFTNSDGNEALECMCDTQTPATSSAIAALRAEWFDSAFDEEPVGFIRRRGESVLIDVNGDPHIKDGMPVFARQLRESKGEVSNG